ncbi:hypothetical protein [Novosphingobium colocasiae]|uniref:hypothetical protein n=1 Tax=Novosphingobium colocasiae TaxID=1256513 RepID=UPI0035B09A61
MALSFGSNIPYRLFMLGTKISFTEKSRGRDRPRKDTVAQHFTMPKELSHGIDAWAAKQDDAPSRPEAIRHLVAKGLGE